MRKLMLNKIKVKTIKIIKIILHKHNSSRTSKNKFLANKFQIFSKFLQRPLNNNKFLLIPRKNNMWRKIKHNNKIKALKGMNKMMWKLIRYKKIQISKMINKFKKFCGSKIKKQMEWIKRNYRLKKKMIKLLKISIKIKVKERYKPKIMIISKIVNPVLDRTKMINLIIISLNN